MDRIKKVINKPSLLLAYLLRKIARVIPDKVQLTLLHRVYIGSFVNWTNPRTFTEKLQWLKIYNRNPLYTKLVDKFAVKDYVANKIGESYIIPTIAVWDNPNDIDWESLPNQFVLKTTHGGGACGVFICKDKLSFNRQDCIRGLKKSLKSDLYWSFREWPYKNVPKRIIAEKYISEGKDLRDYKFFCFNGKVEFFKIDFGRFTTHRANYYSREGTILPFGEEMCPPDFTAELILPGNLSEMILVAEKLSEDLPFVRVDLYNVNGKILFGEITFYPASGFGQFTVEETNRKLGDMLILNL
ncbi:ATP-grasp fold amidoligase family protein [uncultured Bacteroides sp.]|jgi:hypothetical protein|uniref:ATP-grasp fold amidoligase family protein n=1 Tax=uncultured Bacteroides sp. TaxID=162156 RepID=UPI0025F3CF30|nr:ATP-grasp fold amidoligase family protein [uncultured Bacteroides sp.]